MASRASQDAAIYKPPIVFFNQKLGASLGVTFELLFELGLIRGSCFFFGPCVQLYTPRQDIVQVGNISDAAYMDVQRACMYAYWYHIRGQGLPRFSLTPMNRRIDSTSATGFEIASPHASGS